MAFQEASLDSADRLEEVPEADSRPPAAFLAPRVAACLGAKTEEGRRNSILIAALEALAAIGGRETAVALTDVERIAGRKDWETLQAALDALEEITIDGGSANFIVRTTTRGDAGKALQAAGVALGPSVRRAERATP